MLSAWRAPHHLLDWSRVSRSLIGRTAQVARAGESS